MSDTIAQPADTSYWAPGHLLDQVELLGVRVGTWNHFEYADKAPAVGEHNAVAIAAGHDAVKVINEIVCDLDALRGQLVPHQATFALLAISRAHLW